MNSRGSQQSRHNYVYDKEGLLGVLAARSYSGLDEYASRSLAVSTSQQPHLLCWKAANCSFSAGRIKYIVVTVYCSCSALAEKMWGGGAVRVDMQQLTVVCCMTLCKHIHDLCIAFPGCILPPVRQHANQHYCTVRTVYWNFVYWAKLGSIDVIVKHEPDGMGLITRCVN